VGVGSSAFRQRQDEAIFETNALYFCSTLAVPIFLHEATINHLRLFALVAESGHSRQGAVASINAHLIPNGDHCALQLTLASPVKEAP